MPLPRGLGDLLPRYWQSICRAVDRSISRGEHRKATSLLHGLDPLVDAFSEEGYWGVAYPATRRKWAIKVTADPREALAFKDLSDNTYLRQHSGVCYFADAWQLEEKTRDWEYGTFTERTVYVLLRERVDPIPDEQREQPEYVRIVTKLDNIVRLSIDYDHAPVGQKASHYTEVALALVDLERSEPLVAYAAQFMRLYLSATRFALADIHAGNLGRRPGEDSLTIFDLGHPVAIEPKSKEPLFKVLKP